MADKLSFLDTIRVVSDKTYIKKKKDMVLKMLKLSNPYLPCWRTWTIISIKWTEQLRHKQIN